jgi:hypothetical protein
MRLLSEPNNRAAEVAESAPLADFFEINCVNVKYTKGKQTEEH